MAPKSKVSPPKSTSAAPPKATPVKKTKEKTHNKKISKDKGTVQKLFFTDDDNDEDDDDDDDDYDSELTDSGDDNEEVDHDDGEGYKTVNEYAKKRPPKEAKANVKPLRRARGPSSIS